MGIIKLCNIFNKYAEGVLNTHTFNKLIERYKKEDNKDFIESLEKLYKIHDAMYRPLEKIGHDIQDDNFLDLSEKLIGELSNLQIQIKKISNQNIEKVVNRIIDNAKLANKYYTKYFYRDDKPKLGDVIGLCSFSVQMELHEFLDKVTFSYVNYLKDQRNILQ